MEPGKSLLVSFGIAAASKLGNVDAADDSLSKEIALDYSEDDEEMRSDSGSPKTTDAQERNTEGQSFDPVDDLEVFAVDDTHFDTSGGEIRRKTKIEMVFDIEKLGGPPNVRRYVNPKLKTTDTFLDGDEQRTRRAERAKRFGLDAFATESSSTTPMIDEPTPELLNKLYDFYGIDPENSRHKARYRLNTLYLRGVNDMSTENIFEYFGLYSPSYMEWIDDSSCNVAWVDRTAAARALLGMSKPLRRIWPTKSERFDRGQDEEGSEKEEYRSPLTRKSSEQELRHNTSVSPDGGKSKKEEVVDRILNDEEPLDVDVGQFTIPPGSWRVGKDSQTLHMFLFRFSTVDDVKTPDAQRKSRYYRERGNPNFGGQTGFISRSYMDRVSRKRRQSFDEDRPAASKGFFTSDLRKTISDRARWNLLRDDARRDADLELGELVEEEDTETGEVKLTYFSTDDEEMDSEERSKKRPRMRMRADEEEDRKQEKRRRLQRIKTARQRGGGIDGDWRSSQRTTGDLRGVLHDARMKITVPNERGSTKQDLRHRLGGRKSPY